MNKLNGVGKQFLVNTNFEIGTVLQGPFMYQYFGSVLGPRPHFSVGRCQKSHSTVQIQ